MPVIVGSYHLDGRDVSAAELQHMISAREFVNPDVVPCAMDGRVGLAGWQESTGIRGPGEGRVPTSVARAGGCLAVADARLDRRGELVSRLGLDAWTAGPLTDEMLIVRAYARWGERCVQYLEGAFAFAVWDPRTHRLFCARDRLGLRPFYYVSTSSSFSFATAIDSLRALPAINGRINEAVVADYLMQVLADPQATFYEKINRLPAGHTLSASRLGVRIDCYWRPDPDRQIRLDSDEEYAREFRAIFVDAVRDRVAGAPQVGSLLSGGLDSSAVTCTARAVLDSEGARPLDTFSLTFEDVPQSDERTWIDAVCQEGGLRPHFVQGDQIDPFEDLDRMLSAAEEPFFAWNLYLHWHLWKEGRAAGVDVILDGYLGDDVVSHGSRYITELAARGQWIRLAREIRTVAGRQGEIAGGAWSVFRRFVMGPILIEPAAGLRNRLSGSRGWSTALARFVNPDLLEHVGWRERVEAFGAGPQRTPLTAREEHLRGLKRPELPAALEVVYKSASALGIEPRFPYADHRLVEFCLALPPTQKYSGGLTRAVLRRAMKGTVPDAVLARAGKGDLGPAFGRSLRQRGGDELRRHVFELLPAGDAYLNVPELQKAYVQSIDQSSIRGLVPIWLAVILTRWLSRERRSVASATSTTNQTGTTNTRTDSEGDRSASYRPRIHSISIT